MEILTYIKRKYHKTVLARLWHSLAPSFTVKRRFFGNDIFMNFRDNIDDVSKSSAELEHREEFVLKVLSHLQGPVWDVGANVGIFSVCAAVKDHSCVAFEFSEKAGVLLQKTVSSNNLPITVVNRAFTVDEQCYSPAQTSSAENQVSFSSEGEYSSVTYEQAAEKYGVPVLLKMDIEGGEQAFFESPDFKKWLCDHEIVWLVEVHFQQLGHYPEWKDVPRFELDEHHDLYCSHAGKLKELTQKMGL